MPTRVLITTTSFLDTPGPHLARMTACGYETVTARGPLTEEELLQVVEKEAPFDGLLCGEDEVTARVIEKLGPRLKVISKYGVSLEKIDRDAAAKFSIKVSNTPRVNHSAVAELTLGLLIAVTRELPAHNVAVHKAHWDRKTGVELAGKTLGIVGLGRVGKEVAKRALAFGMNVDVYNTNWSAGHEEFVAHMNEIFLDGVWGENPVTMRYVQHLDDLLREAHFVSLHMNISKDNRGFLDHEKLAHCRRGMFIVNVSRGALVDHYALAEALKSGQVAGYAADVLEPEPVDPGNPLLGLPNVVLTPHIASRTFDSVAKQGMAALLNVIEVLGPAAQLT
jgi:D-3-phosphoglycerate dehydrogenase / 2-oxoglutarate reductase